MEFIKKTGLLIFLIGLGIFIGTIFTGSFNLKQTELDTFIEDQNYKSKVIKGALEKAIVTSEKINIFQFSSKMILYYQQTETI